MARKPVFAVDGPAASGKGTLSRQLAAYFAVPHLDTGLTYRAVGYHLLENGVPLDDEDLARTAAGQIDLGALDRKLLSQHHIGEAASRVAVMPSVRVALVDAQRAFAAKADGAILDGRDIGTVVCPDADAKLYVTADADVRAERRFLELSRRCESVTREDVLEMILQRDARDTERADSPMRPADDAMLLDTTKLDISQSFDAAVELIKRKIGLPGT